MTESPSVAQPERKKRAGESHFGLGKHPNTLANLKVGNPGNKGGLGRPPSPERFGRKEFIENLRAIGAEKMSMDVLLAQVEKGDAYIARWLIEMIHGQAKATVRTELAEDTALRAVARITAEYLEPEKYAEWWTACKKELGLDTTTD